MEKLIVRNCGPIKEATVDVRKNTVFIGPQGSGKSTLAKLIALCTDARVLPLGAAPTTLINDYSLDAYIGSDTYFRYETVMFYVEYDGELTFSFTDEGSQLSQEMADQKRNADPSFKEWGVPWSFSDFLRARDRKLQETPPFSSSGNMFGITYGFYSSFFKESILKIPSIYIPSERNLTALLSSAIWSIIYSDISIPKPLALFGRNFEEARNQINKLAIPFLDIHYSYENGRDQIYFKDEGSIELGKSASGYQSIVPLLLVIDYLRKKESRRFVLEEPELNLFPLAQKELMYYILRQDKGSSNQSETVITTHSPYILSSLNNLLFAFKVAESVPEERERVAQVIPSESWLNPNDFSAYFVENGTIRSIMSETTGLIADNELDDVSENIAGEQDRLLTIYRNGQRERTN